MGVYGGPKVSPDGLVFSLDAANRKSISPLGCTGFNGAPQLVKNLISPTDFITNANGVKLGNLSYYTAFAIDFPEGSFGGDAAGRHGITPGFDVRSGTKLYDASRALHLWVWDNDTNSWISSSFFNGLRLSGHCYDSWTGFSGWPTEVSKFVEDFNNIKNIFKNATYIMMGSHRDSGHTTDKINVLLDCGAPSNVSSLLGSAPEWILVGEPGLGAGNAYGWSYENYSTDPTRVAHLNFGLPIYGTKDNYLEFDGVNDGIRIDTVSNLSLNHMTISSWNFSSNYQQNGFMFEKTTNGSVNTQYSLFFNSSNNSIYFRTQGLSTTDLIINRTTAGVVNNQWNNVVATWDGTNKRIYVNGVLRATSATLTGTVTQNNTGPAFIGIYGNFAGYPFNGRIAKTQIYNRALTPQEIQQNYNATKSRFGL